MWNRVSEEIFGWTAKEVIGKKLPIVQKEMAGEFDNLLQKLLKGKPFTKETIRQKKDGTLFDVSIAASPIFDEEGNITSIVAITSDISKRKEADRQKDEFIGIVSHELKTPVTSLKAYEQVLQNRFRKSGDDASAGMLLKMDGQINKLTMLIQDLLDVTKIEGGKIQFHNEYISIVELLDEVIEEVQRTTDTHKIIKKGKSLRKIYGDRDRIGQVVTNLLTNAIKYSAKADRVIVNILEDNENVTVSVQDFGVGIPKKELPHVFDRFFRVDSPVHRTIPGMGLGLYVSAEIVKRLGGNIWAESTEKKGSTFYFTLPIKGDKE